MALAWDVPFANAFVMKFFILLCFKFFGNTRPVYLVGIINIQTVQMLLLVLL